MTARTSEMFDRAAYLGCSEWSEPYDVSWRIVITHPDLSPSIGGDGAADGTGLGPDDLRIVSADAGTGIAANVVSPCFLGPGTDNLGRCRVPPGYGVDVLAISIVGAVRQGTRSNQMVGPFLRHLRELIGPDKRRYTHPGTDCVVRIQHFLGHRCGRPVLGRWGMRTIWRIWGIIVGKLRDGTTRHNDGDQGEERTHDDWPLQRNVAWLWPPFGRICPRRAASACRQVQFG